MSVAVDEKYEAVVKAAREAEKVLTRLRDRGAIGDAPVIRQLASALRALGQ